MKEKYFRYSLIALILTLGLLIASELWPFVNGLLGAFTVYVLVRNQMSFLTEKKGMNKVLSAALILFEVFACVVVPIYILAWVLIARVSDIQLDVSQLTETILHFVTLIQERTGYDIMNIGNIEKITTYSTKIIQFFINQASGVVVTSVVLLFLLYFMLLNRNSIEKYVLDILPFNDRNKQKILTEIHNMVRSNAIGIPLLAIIQGIIAGLGYWIAGVPSPALFGVITAFATIVPIFGTGLVWAPLVIYLYLTGNWVAATGLMAYCVIVLINIDNVIRFLVQKKLADTHPLITVFGVILGLKIFGFWGVIFGPLLLSMFFILVHIFKKEYLDQG